MFYPPGEESRRVADAKALDIERQSSRRKQEGVEVADVFRVFCVSLFLLAGDAMGGTYRGSLLRASHTRTIDL